MKKVFANKEVMILSDKSVVSNERGFFTFEDGSFVDVSSRKIVNKGVGEIVIKDLPLWPEMVNILRDQQMFDGVRHLIISGDMNNIVMIPNDAPNCTVSLGGAGEFVQKVSIYQQGDLLYIETPRRESNVHINIGSVWVNGKRVPPKLEEDFGYIEIKCNGFKSLQVNGRGTGNIYSQVPICELRAKIKGSTSIDAVQIENVDVEISGSGNITVDQLNGSLYGRISGSGSIDILNGQVNSIDVAISGSGSLVAGVEAKNASLSLSGSGAIMVAHVLNEYIEQKTGSGLIKVCKKG